MLLVFTAAATLLRMGPESRTNINLLLSICSWWMQALLHSSPAAFELPVRQLKGEAPDLRPALPGGQQRTQLATPVPMQQAPRRGGPARGPAMGGRGNPIRGHITVSIGGRGVAARGRSSAPRYV